jgi:hypothetical protein
MSLSWHERGSVRVWHPQKEDAMIFALGQDSFVENMEYLPAFHCHEIAKEISRAYDFFSHRKSAGDTKPGILGRIQDQPRSLTPEEKINIWQVYDAIESHCLRIGLNQAVVCARRLKLEVCVLGAPPPTRDISYNGPLEQQGIYPVSDDVQTKHIAYRIEELDNRIQE